MRTQVGPGHRAALGREGKEHAGPNGGTAAVYGQTECAEMRDSRIVIDLHGLGLLADLSTGPGGRARTLPPSSVLRSCFNFSNRRHWLTAAVNRSRTRRGVGAIMLGAVLRRTGQPVETTCGSLAQQAGLLGLQLLE
uniref:Uncharacterized protein n=1 Tax=Cryptomonas curvata TaxID=233186 RepID=A0A7S0N7G2_9CRYP